MPLVIRAVLTLAISAIGAVAMGFTGIAGALLMGGAIAVTIAALAGFKATIPDRVRDVLFIGVGLSMGANVAPDTLQLVGQWPITLAALIIEMVLIVVACGLFLIWVLRLDKATAYLSSFPGHLSFIMALATAGTGDVRQIVVIQVIRVAVLTLFAPIGALFLPVGTFSAGANAEPMAMETLIMAALTCTFVGWVFVRLRMPAGYVLGSMAAATALKLMGLFPGQLPPPLRSATCNRRLGSGRLALLMAGTATAMSGLSIRSVRVRGTFALCANSRAALGISSRDPDLSL